MYNDEFIISQIKEIGFTKYSSDNFNCYFEFNNTIFVRYGRITNTINISHDNEYETVIEKYINIDDKNSGGNLTFNDFLVKYKRYIKITNLKINIDE